MILSTVDCRFCGERLEVAVGPDDADGEIGSDLHCRCCGYREPVRSRWRRRDHLAAIAERNRQCGQDGVEIPYRIDIPAVEP